VWQTLQAELKDKNFTVLAVAMDAKVEAARPWIEAAKPEYPCVIDRDHHVADLYNMVNVPQAVWIDEAGRMARPPETAGAYEGFRQMDRSTLKVPEDAAAATAKARQTYYAALRDWVHKGAASEFVYDQASARSRLHVPSPQATEAHAYFRLGQALLRRGDAAGAETAFGQARTLHPDSWNIWRQTAPVDHRGLATGPAFWAKVDALGDKRYYAQVDMKGMP
jgi:tetratricopeptide (TPR) repeat protein